MQRVPCGRQRLHDQRAHLGGKPAADDDRPVGVLIHMKRTAAVLAGGLVSLGLEVDAPPRADQSLDVVCGARSGEREQLLFGLGRGGTGERAGFGIRDLTTREGGGDARQTAESARDTDPLTGGVEVGAGPPGEPVSARAASAVVPAIARIELADELEQAGARGIEVGGELGDLVAKALELDETWVSRNHVHEEFPLCSEETLTPDFGDP
jgi:hypothetical protein